MRDNKAEVLAELSKTRNMTQPIVIGHSESSVIVDEEELEPVIPRAAEDSPKDDTQSTPRKQVAVFDDLPDECFTPTFWGSDPQTVTCPYCQKTALSRVKRRLASGTVCCCGALLLVCLCFAPLCVYCCQNSEHHCRECGRKVGVRSVF